jgi:hypothetical protein
MVFLRSKSILSIVICRSCSFSAHGDSWMSQEDGLTFSARPCWSNLSLAMVLYSVFSKVPFALSSSKPNFSRVLLYACRIVWGLPSDRGVGLGHHASSIRLGDLDAFIALSLQSRQHRFYCVRICSSSSNVTCSFVIRFSASLSF